ncbi:MAG: helix-turn-helix transcriptional regulator [Oricola sp.]|jgi:HTH-type transcriptional regulator / antitoxin HipB|uniref:helix-turn-helix domain-containing protein n=1 Tax=Hyphococcus sp. TaxID=2038636 RepID=UPI00320BD0FD|nr:helix-turn-helix transcriptional regulator [Oricola sp.]
MQLRTAKHVGAAIRDWRKKRGLDQAELADKVGVSRRWIVQVEKGKPRAAQNLVLKTFDALGVSLKIADATVRGGDNADGFDIDIIVESAKGQTNNRMKK